MVLLGLWGPGSEIGRRVAGRRVGTALPSASAALFPILGTDAVQTLVWPIAHGLELVTDQNSVVSVVTPLSIWSQESAHRSLCPQSP